MKAKFITKNISFKRGRDSKEALDVGMTPPRLMEDTINELKKAGIKVGTSSSTDERFLIQCHKPLSYSIEYSKKPLEWMFAANQGRKIAYSQKDILGLAYHQFADFL